MNLVEKIIYILYCLVNGVIDVDSVLFRFIRNFRVVINICIFVLYLKYVFVYVDKGIILNLCRWIICIFFVDINEYVRIEILI